jgi:hypothetical protein
MGDHVRVNIVYRRSMETGVGSIHCRCHDSH